MKNLSLLPVLFLLLTSAKLFAQGEIENHGEPYTFKPRQWCYIYADSVPARLQPDKNATILKKFHRGDSVMVLSIDDTMTTGGKEAPWCAVGYAAGNSQRRAFIWGGSLSPIALKWERTQFIYNMRSGTKDGIPYCNTDVKALRNDSVIAAFGFPVDAFVAHHSKVIPAKGLKGLKCIVYFYNSGEACGVPTDEQYLGWDGNKFIRFPMLVSASEAGAGYVAQKFIFPADKGGKPGEVLLREESGEFDDSDKIKHKKINK